MNTLQRSLLVVLFATPLARAQTTERASLSASGAEGRDQSSGPVISGDGRFVGFHSYSANLVPGDANGSVMDVFVRDRRTGTLELVSLTSGGGAGDSASYLTSLSADGRFVAFDSYATNLVPGDLGGLLDGFVRDRRNGTTERVTVSSTGAEGDGASFRCQLSADGRFVAFASIAGNLVPGDSNGLFDIFVRDRSTGTTERVSVANSGAEASAHSLGCAISADGRFVAFTSDADNLVRGDANGWPDVFVRDRLLGTTRLATVASDGTQANFPGNDLIAISADGRYVAFDSFASNLVPGDTDETLDVFVHDFATGGTERVNVSSAGVPGNRDSGRDGIAISADGRHVAFASFASNLVPDDLNGVEDIFVRDRLQGITIRASVATGGSEGNYRSGLDGVSLSSDGRFVAFASYASTLVAGDMEGQSDVFVHDLDTTQIALLCEPGRAGVAACPCANPASGPGRGCDNSAATGGASLSATGSARLSADDLSFTASGELSNALSVLVQGDAYRLDGAVYGQGVRCAGGQLKRLFSRNASGGSVAMPDFGAGDPSISSRSAARGDAILAGESRWYLVFYRDPVVLGGCPASSTFNATPTRQATWAP